MIEESNPSIAHDSGSIQSIALEGKEWVPAQNPAVVEEKIKAEAAKEMKKLVKQYDATELRKLFNEIVDYRWDEIINRLIELGIKKKPEILTYLVDQRIGKPTQKVEQEGGHPVIIVSRGNATPIIDATTSDRTLHSPQSPAGDPEE